MRGCHDSDCGYQCTSRRRKSTQASPQCVLACVGKLREIQQRGILVLDDGWLIIKEYKQNLSQTGQPGVGDAFLKWVLINQANRQRCQRVRITPTDDGSFQEFPDDRALTGFDLSDRKFVAVALAHPEKPQILNAVDSDWRDFRTELAVHGVEIEFLCPELLVV